MSPRLIILIVSAGGLAVFLATRTTAPVSETEELLFLEASSGRSLEEVENTQVAVWKQPLEGKEAPELAEFVVRVEVDPTGKKNRLYYYIDEVHGYFADTFNLWLWYMPTPGTELLDSPLRIPVVINDFITANETYKGCLEIVPGELLNINSDIGRDENWTGFVEVYGRAFVTNPDPLPSVAYAMSCD